VNERTCLNRSHRVKKGQRVVKKNRALADGLRRGGIRDELPWAARARRGHDLAANQLEGRHRHQPKASLKETSYSDSPARSTTSRVARPKLGREELTRDIPQRERSALWPIWMKPHRPRIGNARSGRANLVGKVGSQGQERADT